MICRHRQKKRKKKKKRGNEGEEREGDESDKTTSDCWDTKTDFGRLLRHKGHDRCDHEFGLLESEIGEGERESIPDSRIGIMSVRDESPDDL